MSEDYDSENYSSSDSQSKNAASSLREVNRANILNYESDSSEVEQGEDSDDMMPIISKTQLKN